MSRGRRLESCSLRPLGQRAGCRAQLVNLVAERSDDCSHRRLESLYLFFKMKLPSALALCGLIELILEVFLLHCVCAEDIDRTRNVAKLRFLTRICQKDIQIAFREPRNVRGQVGKGLRNRPPDEVAHNSDGKEKDRKHAPVDESLF